MKKTGRWIADIEELNILLYGATKEDVIEKAQRAAREIIADRIAHGELPGEAANPVFAVAARVSGLLRRRGVCSPLCFGSDGAMNEQLVCTGS